MYGGGEDYDDNTPDALVYAFNENPEEEKKDEDLKPNDYDNIKIGELDSNANNVVNCVKAAVREVMKDKLRFR
jgi:hypothetical protein